MEKNFATRLKYILAIAVILNLLIIVMQGISSKKSIEQSKKGLMLVGKTALSSFEGGRRAHMLLDETNTSRFRSFIDSIGADTGVLSLYLFGERGRVLLNTKNVTPPDIDPSKKPGGVIETKNGLFMYHKLKPARHMKSRKNGGQNMPRLKKDVRRLTAGVMLDLTGYRRLVRSEKMFMGFMIILEAILIAIYIYTAKIIKVYTAQSKRLEASEREAELGKMSRVMAHELKNPLSTVKGLMEFSAKKSEGELKEISESCVGELARLDKIINDYLSYGKDIALTITQADLKDISENTAKLLQIDAQQKDISVSIDGEANIKADPEKMRQVIFNLLINAVQGAPKNSEINITITERSLIISNEIKNKDFDEHNLGKPFYTTKTVGTGLGLAIVKRIVQLHGFECEISTDKYFTVEIKYG